MFKDTRKYWKATRESLQQFAIVLHWSTYKSWDIQFLALANMALVNGDTDHTVPKKISNTC